MASEDWGILIGAAVAVSAAIGPWMFSVHAKLAVVASTMKSVASYIHESRRNDAAVTAKLDTHGRRLDEHDERLDAQDARLAARAV